MRDLATPFPMDRELLLYVADMFPAAAVYPGRPYGDMTLRLLVFDYQRHRQPCLGVMHVNIILDGYASGRGRLRRGEDMGPEADFIAKWSSLEPIQAWGDSIDPWDLYDRSFLARLTIANFATERQVPDVETMRLPPRPISRQKIKNARAEHGAYRASAYPFVSRLRCFREPNVQVYWGDFTEKRRVRGWMLADVLRKAPALLLDTVNAQAVVHGSGGPVVKTLPAMFVQRGERVDFRGRNRFVLTLLSMALNSRYKLQPELMTLFTRQDAKGDWSIAEPKTGRDALRKRVEQIRDWVGPDWTEFILRADALPDGVGVGTPSPHALFLVVADARIEEIAQEQGTFDRWLEGRTPLSVGMQVDVSRTHIRP